MTYEQFWNESPELYYDYEEAYIDKLREKDLFQWQLGIYINKALAPFHCKNAPKYPDNPLFYREKPKQPTIEDMKETFMQRVELVNKNFN